MLYEIHSTMDMYEVPITVIPDDEDCEQIAMGWIQQWVADCGGQFADIVGIEELTHPEPCKNQRDNWFEQWLIENFAKEHKSKECCLNCRYIDDGVCTYWSWPDGDEEISFEGVDGFRLSEFRPTNPSNSKCKGYEVW